MSDLRQQRSQSQVRNDDGVRVIVKHKTAASRGRVLLITAFLVLGSFVYLLTDTNPPDAMEPTAEPVTQAPRNLPTPLQTSSSGTADAPPADAQVEDGAESGALTVDEAPLPEYSDDLASYFRPGDREPTVAELIKTLNEAGVHTGIGAFNPPGTSPPLAGLAVPDDFELPKGFVRHHQVTDQGEPLEPILMFSPDIEYYEAAGNVPVPEDRIVTVELAPPGMPIREMIPPQP